MNQKFFNEPKIYRFKRLTCKAYGAFNSLHKVVNIGVVLGCTLAAVPVSSALSQSTQNDMEPKRIEKELEEVMVTASLVEMPLAQTTKLVTIISKEQIEQAPIQSIQDLLLHVAGIDVVQRGGHGVQADLSIRGGSFDQIAILLDGVNLSNPHTGHYSFDFPINISDIQRIEVLHTPSALVHGANAFSGGINIITKKQTDAKAYVNIESGMHKLRTVEVRGATDIGISSNSLSVGHRSSDGYIDNGDYSIYNALWQTRLKTKQSKIDFSLGYNDKQYGANIFYSPLYPNQYERTSTYMGIAKGEFGSELKICPTLYWNRHHDQFDLVKDTDFGRNYHRNDTYGANITLSYKWKLGQTGFSSELRREDILSSNLGKPMIEPHRRYTKYDNRLNASIAGEHTVQINKLVVSVGMLVNHNTLQRSKYSFLPTASASYKLTNNIKLYALWSKSYRLPTFTDLYYNTPTHIGNENLKPEWSNSLEIGIKYNTRFVSAYVAGYSLCGQDIIDWIKLDSQDIKWSAQNHSQIDTKGIELGAKLHLAQIIPILSTQTYLAVDYAHMNQQHNAHNYLSAYSLNYLKNKLTAQFNHQIYNGFSAGWYFRFQQRAGSYEKYENKVKEGKQSYPTFNTLDVKLNYKCSDLNIYLNINNLYNTHYFDIGNMPQAGVWIMGGVNYIFR